MNLRPATPDDCQLLSEWDRYPHVVAATGDDGAEDWESVLATNPHWRWIFIAEVDERPIGLIQIIDPQLEETHYWESVAANLRAIDIWIGPPDALGRGYGTQMMTRALAFCFEEPAVTAVVIDPLTSNSRARTFYERLGFSFVEFRTFGTDDCAVYRIDRGTFTRLKA